MLAKTALIVVSNPKQIGKILPSVQKQVKSTLYVQLLSALTEPLGFHSHLFTTWPKYSQIIHGIYSQAATHCKNLDVRVLLSALKYKNVSQISTSSTIDLVIFDKLHNKFEVDTFVGTKIKNLAKNYNVLNLDSGSLENFDNLTDGKVYKHTVLGGTFDRLHVAHKLLLSEAALRSENVVTVGVTKEAMLPGKILFELIEDLDERIKNVKSFLRDICPELTYHVVPISDPFGPSIVDSSMEMLVVSEETIKGGQKINEIRQGKKLNKLDIFPIQLIDEPNPEPIEETKISSSTVRIRLLGTLLKPVLKAPLSEQPYVIGLTGGVASGKSNVANIMGDFGAEIINCDLIGHNVYKKGKNCYTTLVQHFGDRILASDGEIDRKILGSIVFNDPDQMKALNSIVWPAIAEQVLIIINNSKYKIIVIEAAVLLMAGWQKYCNEVWATLVPREEAVRRLMSRNGLSEDQAFSRINSQPPNKTFVDAANVVLCTLWEFDYTKKQVKKAWDCLQQRLA